MVVLLSLKGGEYYSLNEAGGRVWDLCDGTHSVSDMAAIIQREFDAPMETIQRDLVDLLTDLAHEELVFMCETAADGSSPVP